MKVFHYLSPAFTVPVHSLPITSDCLQRVWQRGVCLYQMANSVCAEHTWEIVPSRLLHWVADSSSAGEGNDHVTKQLSLKCPSAAGEGGSFSLLSWPDPVGHHFPRSRREDQEWISGRKQQHAIPKPEFPSCQEINRKIGDLKSNQRSEGAQLSARQMCLGDLRC